MSFSTLSEPPVSMHSPIPAPVHTRPFTSPQSIITSDPSLTSLSSLQHPYSPSVSADSSICSNGTKSDSNSLTPTTDVDPQIIEALKGKDRIYVLKLGELMEGLINEQQDRISLSPSTSYQRLLVHRCSAYYRLAPENDPASRNIIVCSTVESRIPIKRLSELVQLESISLPAFKIMRRAQNERKLIKSQSSHAGSVTGEDPELSDAEPSESGSLGGRSNTTGGSGKKWRTIEEREAAYNEARSRIFMDFEDKEKGKEKVMSASSSSVSLASSSASTSGGGSSITGDLEDRINSPVTESEYRALHARDKRGLRHNNTSTRSLRSSAPPFSSNSRILRVSSPPFTYSASIYDQTQHQMYDLPQRNPHAGYPQTQYFYPCPPPGPPNPYFQGYPYYPPYNPYQAQNLHPQHSASDSSTPSDSYMAQPPGPYPHPYGWQHPPLQSPPQLQSHPPQATSTSLDHSQASFSPHIHHNPQFLPYMSTPPPQAYGHPMIPCFSQFERQIDHPAPPMAATSHDAPSLLNGNVTGNQSNVPTMNANSFQRHPNTIRTSNNYRSPNGFNGNGQERCGPYAVDQTRSAWCYAPGTTVGGRGPFPSTSGISDSVGPRLISRKQSGNGCASTASNRSSDEVSSTASSSTSSSRQTYTSGTSSQHPLPPRPDWAVGLKPETGSYNSYQKQARQHEHQFTGRINPVSPPRNFNGNFSVSATSQTPQMAGFAPLNDFPPLSETAEKRFPIASGAWGKPNTNHVIRSASSFHPSSNVPIQLSNHQNGIDQGLIVDPEYSYERPPPKSAELFNPNVLKRMQDAKDFPGQSKGLGESDKLVNGILLAQVQSMNLACQNAGNPPRAVIPNEYPSVTVGQ